MLQESSFDEPDKLLSAVQELFREIDLETLDAYFKNG
jgi:hypothetical protein